MDDETQRWAELRELKRRRLHELDKLAALHGANTPAEVAIERAALRQELGMVEAAIISPARPEIGDELGERGRFLYYGAELKRANDAITALGEHFAAFVEDSQEWRAMHRQWIILIGIVVVITLLGMAIVATYVFSHGGA